jgi:hypothetical protein
VDSFIDHLPLPAFWMMVGFLVAVAAIFVVAGLHARRQVAAMRSMPTSNLGMATSGYVEIEGQAEPIDGRSLTAPLTDSPCVWFRARVEEWIPRRGEQSSHWATVRDETSVTPFLVRDATGAAVVHPHGADVTPSDRSVWYGGREEPDDRSPERLPPAEWSSPAVEISGGPNSRYRFTEERVYAEAPLLVLGELSDTRFGSPSVADDDDEDEADEDDLDVEAAAGESFLSRPAEPDEDDDVDEASAAQRPRRTWEDTARIEQLTESAAAVTPLHIARGASRKPFILSTTLQAVHVAQSEMGSQAALSLAPVPLLIAAFLIWVRFG